MGRNDFSNDNNKIYNNHKHNRLSNKGIIIISVVMMLILSIIISLIIVFNTIHTSIYENPSATASQQIETITLPPTATNSNEPIESQVPIDLDVYKPIKNIEYILFFGLAEYDLADTIWVVILNKTDNTVDFMSIPRDTYLRYFDRKNPDHWKINSYYNNFKNDNWVKTDDATSSMYLLGACEMLLNIDMDYYIRVSYETIEKIVDSMGGIEYDVPFDMLYYDLTEGNELIIEIYEGYQILSGKDVVKFLRFRQGVGYENISDISRISRQHSMVNAIIKKALKMSNISSVIDVAKSNIKTNIGKEKLASYISFAMGLNSERISFHTLKGYESMVDTKVKDIYGEPIIKSFWVTDYLTVRQQIISICE